NIFQGDFTDGNTQCTTSSQSLRRPSPHEPRRESGQRRPQHRPAPDRGPCLDLGRVRLAGQLGAASPRTGHAQRGGCGMTIILTDEQSILYLEGGWDAYRIEEDILEHLDRQHITEPVAVVLSDRSAVAFYVTQPGVVL